MRKSGLGKLFGMVDVAPAESVAAEVLQDVEMVVREKRGMILPFQPLSLTFHNMNYYVDMPKVSWKIAVCDIENNSFSFSVFFS